MSKEEKNTGSLALRNVERTLTALGLVGAGIGSAGTLLPSVGAAQWVIKELTEWSQEKEKRRTTRLIADLERRLHAMETDAKASTLDESLVDPFRSVFKRAIEDDDEQKPEFYAAILAWIIRDKPRAAMIKIVAGAVTSLTAEELYAFVGWVKSKGNAKISIDGVPNDKAFWRRIEGLGLFVGASMIHVVNVTPVGKVIADECIDCEIHRDS